MSELIGLHNPDRHHSRWTSDGVLWCDPCDSLCSEDGRCYCCLAAEVEHLRGVNRETSAALLRVNGAVEKLQRVQDIITSDEAVYVFGIEWNKANSRLEQGAAYKPGDRRRSALRAVADLVDGGNNE